MSRHPWKAKNIGKCVNTCTEFVWEFFLKKKQDIFKVAVSRSCLLTKSSAKRAWTEIILPVE